MKYIAIFEDNKRFSRVLEFAQLPHEYKFVEYNGSYMANGTKPIADTEVIFYPKGEMKEVYGQKVQQYRQKDY